MISSYLGNISFCVERSFILNDFLWMKFCFLTFFLFFVFWTYHAKKIIDLLITINNSSKIKPAILNHLNTVLDVVYIRGALNVNRFQISDRLSTGDPKLHKNMLLDMFNKNIFSNFVYKHCRRDEMGSSQDQKQVYNDGYFFSHK